MTTNTTNIMQTNTDTDTDTGYTPESLQLWTLPPYYMGAEWPDYYVFLSRTRDSDCLTQSNFDVALRDLGGETGAREGPDGDYYPVTVVREGHWGVGWIEWIAIHKTNTAALEVADELAASLAYYPVLDDEDLSNREYEEAERIWSSCYKPAERIAYIRRHRNHFNFSSFRDLLAQVRGQYYGGYAPDLIY